MLVLRIAQPLTWILAWGLVVGDAPAQPREQKPSSTTIKGQFHSFRGDVVRIVVDGKQGWQVQVAKNAVVVVKGSGGPELLRAGMPVRFYAMLTKKGRAFVPVDHFEVFTPEPGFRPVAIEEPLEESPLPERAENGSETPAGESGREDESEQDPDGSSDTEGEGTDADTQAADGRESGSDAGDRAGTAKTEDRRTRARKARDEARAAVPTRRFFVAGTLASLKKGRFVVVVGRQKVQGVLAENTSVEIESNDFRIARPGDDVEAAVRYYQPGQGRTSDIKITLRLPPPESTKKKPARTTKEK